MWRNSVVSELESGRIFAAQWSCSCYVLGSSLFITQLKNCLLFHPQMKSFSTFCRSLRGNRGAVCTVTPSPDSHTGLGRESLKFFLHPK